MSNRINKNEPTELMPCQMSGADQRTQNSDMMRVYLPFESIDTETSLNVSKCTITLFIDR